MSKKILLARPHPFIVSDMTPFLVANGYSPIKLDDLAELATAKASDTSGAVISLAVQSSMGESVGTVYNALRQQFPRLPIVFAGLMNMEVAAKAIERIVQAAGQTALVLGVGTESERHPLLGMPDTYIYIARGDLAAPERAQVAARVLQRHLP